MFKRIEMRLGNFFDSIVAGELQQYARTDFLSI